ncbi:hypothetical protein GUITHDRAFT_110866 [Guillardia theta CCMP2712]|uniref:Uncharacterized protein n=1 Tax=Guillardia theta (strain CCMP2712) TaxID=905079 RepID=L1J4T4_GUITC|nr:hypothetical protein GUITHDRAFT_110866 [Guillardia theta CCMP2712]EKX43139.1 hypothetical protein GUITHDRAFT_110866 [Guillardia theta CCMP2712]|eukprot:XP_005830119.1 hypothetical protein GUITHDRAFT_110866 [Guillardia theta CCMP2712]
MQTASKGRSAASKESPKSIASPVAVSSLRLPSPKTGSEGKSSHRDTASTSAKAAASSSPSSSKKKGKEPEDNDDNLDDLWEENIPLKLQEKLENIGSSGNEAEPKMEFDRTTGSWIGNEDILEDFESPLQSPKRSDSEEDVDKCKKEELAFTLNDEELRNLKAASGSSEHLEKAWFREGQEPWRKESEDEDQEHKQ